VVPTSNVVISTASNVDSNSSNNKRGVLTRSTSNNELNIKNNNISENVNSPANAPRERRHTATSRKDVYLYNNNSTTATITSFSNKPEVSSLKPDISPAILSSSAPSSATSSSPLPRVSRSRKEFNRSISSSEHAGNRKDGSIVGNVGKEGGSDSFQKIGKLLKLNNSDSTENESNTSLMSTDSPSPSRSNTPESKRAIDNTTTINNTNNKVEEGSNLSSSRKHGSEKRVINKLVAENNSKMERRKTDDVSKIGNSESSTRRKAVSVNSDSQSNKLTSFVVTTLSNLPTTTITTPPNNNPTTTITNSNNTNDLTDSSSPRIIDRRNRSNSSNTNNLQPLSSSPNLLSSNSPSTSPHSSPRSISPRNVQTKRTIQTNKNSGSSPRSMGTHTQ
jgi:hypothetical protein